jgi:orotate phosphoribosyltransferase
MDAGQQEILDIFTRTRALLQGHFVLRSGLHSGHYFQCAQVCQRMDAVERLAELLLAKIRAQGLMFSTVLAPAMGGLVIGQEVARQAKARYIFAEKENNVLVMRRGFTLSSGEPVLIVEDVVTRGGRVLESLDIVRNAGGTPVAVAMLVDRSSGAARFDVTAVSLLELSFPTFPADAVPDWLAKIPVEKPGS